MKKNALSSLLLTFAIVLLLTACSPAAAPQAPAVQAATPVLPTEPPPTGTPAPTETLAPTEAPPLTCRIVFDSDRDGNREIYRMEPDGSHSVNLTNHPGDDFNPAWSPDGSRIAFVSNRENEPDGGQFIYVMNADGSQVRQLTRENDSDWPDWSPDGRQITYTSQGDIFVMDAGGSGQAANLTHSPEKDAQATWSPDGSQIAWLSGEDWKWNVFVMSPDGSHVRQITDNGQVSTLAWTVDGRIFTNWGWTGQDEFCHNCVVNPDGSDIVDVGGKGELQRYMPFWTVSGERVELTNTDSFDGNEEIYLIGQALPDVLDIGIGAVNLTNNPARDSNPDYPANCGPGAGTDAAVIQPVQDSHTIVIGYAGDRPEQSQRKDNFQKACEELGLRCLYGDVPGLIAQGVDAVVHNTGPSGVEELTPSLLEAQARQIPVFVLDAESDLEGTYSVTIDPRQWVNTSLEWMLEGMGGAGDLAYFDFQPDHPQAAIIEDLLEKYPGVTVVTHEEDKYTFKEGKGYVNTLMEEYPNLQAIWSNDSLSTIVLGVADNRMPSQTWPLLMCEPSKEGLYIWKDRLTDFPAMRCIAVSNPPGIAYDAVYAAYYLLTGAQIDPSALDGPYGRSLYVNSPVITNDNLQEWLEKIGTENDPYIVDERMAPAAIQEEWFLE
ncbi:MAG: substrate-binding domain-containing protein [Chloroflexi bacterium]|nr:substrate-binding domain-containing protein [Chloroflexota bacterium]